MKICPRLEKHNTNILYKFQALIIIFSRVTTNKKIENYETIVNLTDFSSLLRNLQKKNENKKMTSLMHQLDPKCFI